MPRNCSDDGRTTSLSVQAFVVNNLGAYLLTTPFSAIAIQCNDEQDVDPVRCRLLLLLLLLLVVVVVVVVLVLLLFVVVVVVVVVVVC